MPDVIRHPCFNSALPGYAQHKRPRVRPERSEVEGAGVRGRFQLRHYHNILSVALLCNGMILLCRLTSFGLAFF